MTKSFIKLATGVNNILFYICGLYKPMTIVNDDSRVVNKLEAYARVIIYDCYMCKVQDTVI